MRKNNDSGPCGVRKNNDGGPCGVRKDKWWSMCFFFGNKSLGMEDLSANSWQPRKHRPGQQPYCLYYFLLQE